MKGMNDDKNTGDVTAPLPDAAMDEGDTDHPFSAREDSEMDHRPSGPIAQAQHVLHNRTSHIREPCSNSSESSRSCVSMSPTSEASHPPGSSPLFVDPEQDSSRRSLARAYQNESKRDENSTNMILSSPRSLSTSAEATSKNIESFGLWALHQASARPQSQSHNPLGVLAPPSAPVESAGSASVPKNIPIDENARVVQSSTSRGILSNSFCRLFATQDRAAIPARKHPEDQHVSIESDHGQSSNQNTTSSFPQIPEPPCGKSTKESVDASRSTHSRVAQHSNSMPRPTLEHLPSSKQNNYAELCQSLSSISQKQPASSPTPSLPVSERTKRQEHAASLPLTLRNKKMKPTDCLLFAATLMEHSDIKSSSQFILPNRAGSSVQLPQKVQGTDVASAHLPTLPLQSLSAAAAAAESEFVDEPNLPAAPLHAVPQNLFAFESGIDESAPLTVLCGRGGLINKHPGNIIYRKLVDFNKAFYQTVQKKHRILVSQSIVQSILNRGGRFLTHGSKREEWVEVDFKRAVQKTSQALRERANAASEEGDEQEEA